MISVQRWAAGAALCAAVVLGGCAKNPVTGRTELSLISENEEIAIGVQSRPAIHQEFNGLYRGQNLQAYVSGVGTKVARVGHRPQLPYTFEVLNSSDVNAFALPGGKLFITRGLLTRLSNEAQLAGVLGHEVGHVTAKHAVRSVSNAILLQIPLIVGATYAQAKGKGEYLVALGAISASLLQLRFSRRHELESDRLGAEYAYKAGYNPEGMVQVLEVLAEASGPEAKGMGWLQTHPLSSRRIEEAQELIAKNYPEAEAQNLAWNPEQFSDALAQLRGEQRGFDNFDLAEAARESGNYQDAVRLYDSAVAQVPQEPIFYVGRGLAYAQLGQANPSRSDLQRAAQLAPDLYVAQYALGLAEYNAGNGAAAAQAFSASRELFPTNPYPYYYLGQIAENRGETTQAVEYYGMAQQLAGDRSDVASAALDGLSRLGQ